MGLNQRSKSFRFLMRAGGSELDQELDNVFRRIKELQEQLNGLPAAAEPKTAAVAARSQGGAKAAAGFGVGAKSAAVEIVRNNAKVAFSSGEVVGLDSDKKFAKALAHETGLVIPLFVAASGGNAFDELAAVYVGVVELVVETAIEPAAGEPAWMSSTEAGRATNAVPSNPGLAMLLGMWTGPLNRKTGRAEAIVNLAIQYGRTV